MVSGSFCFGFRVLLVSGFGFFWFRVSGSFGFGFPHSAMRFALCPLLFQNEITFARGLFSR